MAAKKIKLDGIDEELKLEVTRVVLMENGDVVLSPKMAGVVKVLVFGLPLVGFGVYAAASGLDFAFMGIFALAFGGVLTYVGVSGLSAPEITFDIGNKVVRVKKRGEQAGEQWRVEAICKNWGQPFSISGLSQAGMGVVRAKLALGEDRSIVLFTTGNRRNAMKIAQWINNALEISSLGG